MAIQNIDIADKTTLDSVKTDTTVLKGMGGIKYNSTTSKPQVYDTTNSTWVDLQVGGGGGANPTLIVVNDSGTMTNKPVTVESQDGLFTQTKTMTSANYEVYELPWLGTYYIKWTLNGVQYSQTAVVDAVGGVVSTACIPRLTVINKNRSYDNRDFTVTSSDETESYTITMPANTSIDVELKGLGTYNITYQGDLLDTPTTITTVVSTVSGSSVELERTASYPSFADATDAGIATMVALHYQDEIDLSTIWAVGDTRTISLSAMEATGVGESHDAQTVQMAILDFDHDDLVEPINGHTKAAITLQQVDGLYNRGYMNSSNTNSGGWNSSARKTWCNNVYYNALPSDFKSIVKLKKTKASAGSLSPTITTSYDYCFLVSEIEVFGSRSYSFEGEGTQYPYYTVASRRIKNSNGVAGNWWGRSPISSSSTDFCRVNSAGSAFSNVASASAGLAPACCL